MRRSVGIGTLYVLFSSLLSAQLVWTDVSSQYQLHPGVKIVRGERSSPYLLVHYIDVNGKDPSVAIRSYYSSSIKTVAPFAQSVGALAAVNGGYFATGTSTSYSAVVYPDSLVARNIGGVTRPAGAYTMTRSLFSMDAARRFRVDWIYHFGNTPKDIHRYSAPTPNTSTTPAPAPLQASGSRYDSILVGIGGAPTLVKNGLVHITYDEEVMFGSGVGRDNGDPRTAVGYTANGHVIMLTADGRGTSVGVSLPELAQMMIDLGCVEAMNLDGGGSTQMAAKTSGGYTVVNTPSESRPVPTILAVVPADSAHLPAIPTFQRVMDTGDEGVTKSGANWTENATTGYWGGTKALLALLTAGPHTVTFTPHSLPALPLEVHAWWPAVSFNSKDTPFIVRHKNGTDTVRVDQSMNAGKWVPLGTFTFAGDGSDAVTVSNNASTGFAVCADAVRFVSYDPALLPVRPTENAHPSGYSLRQNFPNPFNPSTTIPFSLPAGRRHMVTLQVYDMLGRPVATLWNGTLEGGEHSVVWNAGTLSSGLYIVRLRSGPYIASHIMTLLR